MATPDSWGLGQETEDRTFSKEIGVVCFGVGGDHGYCRDMASGSQLPGSIEPGFST